METTTIDYPRGITFEQVWAALMEDRKQMQESNARFDREMQESSAKFDREMKERREEHEKMMQETNRIVKENAEAMQKSREEFDRRMKETERLVKSNGEQIGGLHNSFGELAEHLVAPGIAMRFNELGYHFNIEIPKRFIIKEQGKIKTEIDILLINGECIIAVEVKARVQANKENNDINYHIQRLAILRKYWPMEQRKLLGAIAGAMFEHGAKEAALQAGFFVLEQSGDTMQMDLPEGFVPREW